MTARFTPPAPPMRSENNPPGRPDRRGVGTTTIADKAKHVGALFGMMSTFGFGVWVVLVGVSTHTIGWLEGVLIALFGLPAFVVGSVWVLFPMVADFHTTRVVVRLLYQHVSILGGYWSILFRGFGQYADRNYAKQESQFAVVHDWQLNGVHPDQVDDLRNAIGDYGSQIDQLARMIATMQQQGIGVEMGRVVDAESVDGSNPPVGAIRRFDQTTRQFSPIPYTDHMRTLVDMAIAGETPSIRNATERRHYMTRPEYDVAIAILKGAGIFVRKGTSVGLRPGIMRRGDLPADVQERIGVRLSMGGYND